MGDKDLKRYIVSFETFGRRGSRIPSSPGTDATRPSHLQRHGTHTNIPRTRSPRSLFKNWERRSRIRTVRRSFAMTTFSIGWNGKGLRRCVKAA